jgi:hypothetical protein
MGSCRELSGGDGGQCALARSGEARCVVRKREARRRHEWLSGFGEFMLLLVAYQVRGVRRTSSLHAFRWLCARPRAYRWLCARPRAYRACRCGEKRGQLAGWCLEAPAAAATVGRSGGSEPFPGLSRRVCVGCFCFGDSSGGHGPRWSMCRPAQRWDQQSAGREPVVRVDQRERLHPVTGSRRGVRSRSGSRMLVLLRLDASMQLPTLGGRTLCPVLIGLSIRSSARACCRWLRNHQARGVS